MSSEKFSNQAEEAWIHYIAQVPWLRFIFRLFSIALINIGFSAFYFQDLIHQETLERFRQLQTETNEVQKVAIITGGNSGIGFEVALELCSVGYKVIIGCRDQHKGEKAVEFVKAILGNQCDIEYALLDLSSFDSVRNFAANFLSKETKLDILINNAAVFALPEFKCTKDSIEEQYQINYLSHFLLTRLLVPRLTETPNSRVINMTSCLYFAIAGNFEFSYASEAFRYNPLRNYCISKAAIVLSTQSFKERLSPLGILNYAVHPGFVCSKLYQHCAPFNTLSRFLSQQNVRLPSHGTATVIFLALTPSEELSDYSKSCYFSDRMPMLTHENFCHRSLREDLWIDSSLKVGLDPNFETSTF